MASVAEHHIEKFVVGSQASKYDSSKPLTQAQAQEFAEEFGKSMLLKASSLGVSMPVFIVLAGALEHYQGQTLHPVVTCRSEDRFKALAFAVRNWKATGYVMIADCRMKKPPAGYNKDSCTCGGKGCAACYATLVVEGDALVLTSSERIGVELTTKVLPYKKNGAAIEWGEPFDMQEKVKKEGGEVQVLQSGYFDCWQEPGAKAH